MKKFLRVLGYIVFFITLVSAVFFYIRFENNHPGFISASTYDKAYLHRMTAEPNTLSAEAINDLVSACSKAYNCVYGGEVSGGFVTTSYYYEASANFYGEVTLDNGAHYHFSIPFDYEDAQLIYKALDGSYNYDPPKPLLEINYDLALNRLLDVSVSVVGWNVPIPEFGRELSLDPPRFTSVQAEDELASKVESEEVVPLGKGTVENINAMFELQGITTIQAQEAYVTDYGWQNFQRFLDPSYEITPTILWIRSTDGDLYAFEVPDWDFNPQFLGALQDPECWFAFFFSNAGTLSKVHGPIGPSVFEFN